MFQIVPTFQPLLIQESIQSLKISTVEDIALKDLNT
jgi:hypothetical protein